MFSTIEKRFLKIRDMINLTKKKKKEIWLRLSHVQKMRRFTYKNKVNISLPACSHTIYEQVMLKQQLLVDAFEKELAWTWLNPFSEVSWFHPQAMPKDVHALGLLFQQHAVTVPRTEKYLKMKNEPSTETAEGNLHIREWTTKR